MIKKRIGLAGLVIGLILIAWVWSPLQFTNITLGRNLSLLFILAIFVSIGTACICLIGRRWLAIITSMSFFLIATICTLLMFVSMIGGGPFTLYEQIGSVQLEHSRVVAYRTNSGATISFGIEIIQEMPLFPGVMVVRQLHAEEGYSARLKLKDDGTVVATLDDKTLEYEVLDFVYR